MNIFKKFWLWKLEFKINRLPTKTGHEKIEFLTKQLLKELENNGYDIYTENMGHLDINNYYSDNTLTVSNVLNDFTVECGTYESKLMKK